MPGYSSDQFYNIKKYEARGLARKPSDNPNFSYPGKTMPNIYDIASTDVAARKKDNGGNTNTVVQRGFIKGIFPEVINDSIQSTKSKSKAVVERRCFFQFNPALILRSVEASTTVLNPLLQAPTQLLQPIPGQATFSFDLLFNREREVSNYQYVKNNGNAARITSSTPNLEAYDYDQQDVGQLGVLVDLQVLDSIIGQSITTDTLDIFTKYATNAEAWGASATYTNKITDEAIQKVIMGNSAFLSPMPVRVVFSSLFMVEGFVTSSAVAFHKFSKEMVPTVAQVTISMQALYIGFAKKSGYVTQTLRETIQDNEKKNKQNTENETMLRDYLTNKVHTNLKNLTGFYVGVSPPLTFNEWADFAIQAGREADNLFLNNWLMPDAGFEYYEDSNIGFDTTVSQLSLTFIDCTKLGVSYNSGEKLQKAYDLAYNKGQRIPFDDAIFFTLRIVLDESKKFDPNSTLYTSAKRFKSNWKTTPVSSFGPWTPGSYFGTSLAIVYQVSYSGKYKDAFEVTQNKAVQYTKINVHYGLDPSSQSTYAGFANGTRIFKT